jgi:hypothetical protein
MKIEGVDTLVLTREELKSIIRNNRDKSEENIQIENILISIIDKNTIMSEKVYKWILSKITYITNTNKDYKNIKKKFNGFVIIQ